MTKVRYLVLHDFEVARSSQNGVNCDHGGATSHRDTTRRGVFRGLHIHDVGG